MRLRIGRHLDEIFGRQLGRHTPAQELDLHDEPALAVGLLLDNATGAFQWTDRDHHQLARHQPLDRIEVSRRARQSLEAVDLVIWDVASDPLVAWKPADQVKDVMDLQEIHTALGAHGRSEKEVAGKQGELDVLNPVAPCPPLDARRKKHLDTTLLDFVGRGLLLACVHRDGVPKKGGRLGCHELKREIVDRRSSHKVPICSAAPAFPRSAPAIYESPAGARGVTEELYVDTRAFLDRITSKRAVVGVVGLGYVGLPLVITFGKKGFNVVGFDIDQTKVDKLLRGESYIKHIDAKGAKDLIDAKKLTPTTDFGRVKECDAILICVPTPLNKNREPDMTYIENTALAVGPHLRSGQLVVLESTTYPGTTDELLKDILESQSGLKAGKDFFLAFSPEREDPGNAKFNTQTIPKVVGGLTPACGEASAALYSAAIDKVVSVSSTRVAEMTKLLENIFRCVNIALVNELKIVCDRMDIDIWEVIEASSTKPFGFMPFYPGPGLGGHCIPIDPFYLTWKAREYDVATRFIELAGDINADMPRYVVERTAEVLNSQRKALNGCTILVVGVTYKKDIDDVRESPAFRVIELLRERGVDVVYHDPFIPKLPPMRKHHLEMASVPLKPETFTQCDAAIIVTDHSSIDYQALVDGLPLVIDTRNATKKVAKNRHKIYKA